MGQIRYLLKGVACTLAGCLALGACTSEDEATSFSEGKGTIKIGLTAATEFEVSTRAVDESSYEDLGQYTVQIMDSDGNVVDGCEWTGDNLPTDLVELDNGSYTLKAFTGADYEGVGYSTDGFYVAGESSFEVNSDQVEVSVECTPQCARVKVNFDESMGTYFDDYYVIFSGTEAMGTGTYLWEKDDKDPAYLYLTEEETVTATIGLVQDGKTSTSTVRTKTLSPADAWTLNIAPAEESGKVGISIEIDTSTNDKEVDIEIPFDWL